jgi:hypothetical protein
MIAWLIALALIAAAILALVFSLWFRLRRAEFICTYRWPPGLLKRLEKHRPGLVRKDSALVSRGLRPFFLAYLMNGRRYVSMPSQVADDLWHQFVLYAYEYNSFCRRAFEGLPRTPNSLAGESQSSKALPVILAERQINEVLRTRHLFGDHALLGCALNNGGVVFRTADDRE